MNRIYSTPHTAARDWQEAEAGYPAKIGIALPVRRVVRRRWNKTKEPGYVQDKLDEAEAKEIFG